VQEALMMEQLQTFVLTIALGIFIGLAHDTLRAFRVMVRFSRTARFFTDVLFWVLMTGVVFLTLLSSNWGEVRAYVFIGLGTGGVLYLVLASRPVYQAILRLFTAIARLVSFLSRPIRWLAAACRAMALTVAGGGRRALAPLKKIPTKLHRKKKE
jgi:spore cortex biosynthesis protein YabQ